MGFLWGVETSSHQIEGDNRNNDWWAWENSGRLPAAVRSGRATDHWRLFREDLRLAEELGLNSYRFLVEWSRIEPKEGCWDPEALEWYLELIAECEKRHLLPMMTLHHFTSPVWFAEQGGFTSEQASFHFERFARKMAGVFGTRVPLWCTLNEPMVLSVGAYLGGFMPPGDFSVQKFAASCAGLLKSHVAAYRAIHAVPEAQRKGPWRDHPLMVGMAQNWIQFRPSRFWHPVDGVMSCLVDRFYNRSWLDAATGGAQRFSFPGVIPGAPLVHEALGSRTLDFVGLNYYTRAYIRLGKTADSALPMLLEFAQRGETRSDLGWSVYPAGLRRAIRRVGDYGLPIYVTENGVADREDRIRASYLMSHLREVARAVDEGADVRGYYHWSLMDNFEWVKGFEPRFGLYEVDYTSLNRRIRPSGELYRKLIRAHRDSGVLTPSLELLGS